MARFKKGESGNPAGRKPGSKNKIPRDLRAKVLHAWETLEVEGKDLATIAREDPRWFYELVKAMLPKELNLRVINSVDDLTDEEKANIVRSLLEKEKLGK